MRGAPATIEISMYERMVSKIPLPYYISWLIVAEFLFLIGLLLSKFTSGSNSYILVPIFISLIIAFIPSAIIWESKRLPGFGEILKNIIDQPESEVTSWYRNQLKAILSSTRLCISGAIFAAVFVPSVGMISKWWQFPVPWYESKVCEIYSTFMLTVTGFVVGTGLHELLFTALLVFRLSELDLKITIYQHPLTSIKAIGTTYMQFALIAAIAEVIFIFAFIASPLRMTSFSAFWLIIISLSVIVYFIAPLFRIHKKMTEVKYHRIYLFSEHLDKAFTEVTAEPSSENIERLRELWEIHSHLNRMSEWPFDPKTVIKLLSAIVIPIAAVLIQAKDIIRSIFK